MPALASLEDGKVACGCLHAQSMAWHTDTDKATQALGTPTFNSGPKGAGGSSEQRNARWFPEAPGQVIGLLDHQLRGDDAQVHGQQFVALHYLCLVVLAVITQQLPGEEKTGTWQVQCTQATPF